MKKRSRFFFAGVFLVHLFGASAARAAEEKLEGSVMSLQDQDVVLDLGAAKGIESGDVVEVWRPLRVKHPVTGQVIQDRYRIARLKITQVRPALSIGKVEGDVDRQIVAGDIVILTKVRAGTSPASTALAPAPAPAPKPATPAPTPSPSTKASPADTDARDLNDLFSSLRGSTPEQRITAYRKYVMDHPQSRHSPLLWSEASDLEKKSFAGVAAPRAPTDTPTVIGFSPPARATSGVPLHLAMEIVDARGAVFHVRRQGEAGFTSSAMNEDGPAYFETTLSVQTMRAGTIEYFVEATDKRGTVHEVAGSPGSPLSTAIEDRLPDDPTAHEKNGHIIGASLLTDYASFNSGKTNDYVWQTEALLSFRRGDTGLRAVRSGFGAYRGRGGTLADLDEKRLEGRDVGLTYGYLEAEIGLAEVFSIAGRAIIGLREEGVNGGAQAFLRFGNDRRTNLLVGGEVLGGIGLRGITQLEWNAFPRVPIMFRTEVTNQPAGVSVKVTDPAAVTSTSTGQGEVGVRSIAQIGYRITPNFVVAARGSFQARTINHAGPGAGAMVMYEW